MRRRLVYLSLLLCVMIVATSCSKDDSNDPLMNTSMPDPEGTKSMYLKQPVFLFTNRYTGVDIYGYTLIFFNNDAFVYCNSYNICCGNQSSLYANNLYTISSVLSNDGSNIEIADIGLVNGLGNITKKPTSGWSQQASLIQGNGYVVRIGNPGAYTYVRLYVVSEKYDGAQVKYQYPF